MTLDAQIFEEFCLNNLPDIIRASGKVSFSNSESTVGIVTCSEVNNFKKSIDKSQSDFP